MPLFLSLSSLVLHSLASEAPSTPPPIHARLLAIAPPGPTPFHGDGRKRTTGSDVQTALWEPDGPRVQGIESPSEGQALRTCTVFQDRCGAIACPRTSQMLDADGATRSEPPAR
eukprot:scaffold625_cov324-Pavlova_lutheri.AAC.128